MSSEALSEALRASLDSKTFKFDRCGHVYRILDGPPAECLFCRENVESFQLHALATIRDRTVSDDH